MVVRIFLISISFLFFLSTAHAQIEDETVSCPSQAADTTGWKVHDEGGFVFKLPSRFKETEMRSPDSQGRVYKADSASVYYDFGRYSNPLIRDEHNSFPGMQVCQREESLSQPRIIAYRDDGGIRLSAHWSKLKAENIELTVGGEGAGKRGLTEILAVIQSVQFSPKYR